MLFSQPNTKQPNLSIIPAYPTNNDSRTRTVNVNVSSGPDDWTRFQPWRAPGSAPVAGSGCGVAGGGDVWNANGGWPARGMSQGQDPLTLPAGPQTNWTAGSTVEVAWGMWANHGGGYSYRLCKIQEGVIPPVTEECFQKTPLKFASDKQWLQHINGTRIEVPIVKVTEGTTPAGSEWARVPFPECADNAPCAGAASVAAALKCASKHGMGDICNQFEYPEPIPDTHGFGHSNSTTKEDGFHDYSIVDKVIIPADLPAGDYLFSWRWDCEQTFQIWQNCADVKISVSASK